MYIVVVTFLCLYINLINILEKVHIEAMRNILGGTRLTPLRDKGNNKITELRTILQRESQNS